MTRLALILCAFVRAPLFVGFPGLEGMLLPFCAGDCSSKGGAGPMALSEQELQHIAVADVERQVAGVEAVYKALMSQVTDSPCCH